MFYERKKRKFLKFGNSLWRVLVGFQSRFIQCTSIYYAVFYVSRWLRQSFMSCTEFSYSYDKIHFYRKVIKQDLLLLLLCCCTILRPSVSRKKTCEVMKFFNFLGSKRFPNYPSTMYSVGLSSCIIIFMFTLGFLELLV